MSFFFCVSFWQSRVLGWQGAWGCFPGSQKGMVLLSVAVRRAAFKHTHGTCKCSCLPSIQLVMEQRTGYAVCVITCPAPMMHSARTQPHAVRARPASGSPG